MVISKDDQIQRPQLNISLSRWVRIHVKQHGLWLAPRAERPCQRLKQGQFTRAWTGSSDSKNHTNHCATEPQSQVLSAWKFPKPSQEFTCVYLFYFFQPFSYLWGLTFSTGRVTVNFTASLILRQNASEVNGLELKLLTVVMICFKWGRRWTRRGCWKHS